MSNAEKLAQFIQTNLRSIGTIVNGTTAITHANSGLLLIDATAGNVIINLPAATVPCRFEFRRIDSSSNTVTINRAGSDTIEGATSVTMVGSSATRVLTSDGVSKWYASLLMEQGTFTPTARGTGTTGVFTYTAQSGNWQRIGNKVYFSLNIGWSASTGTGGLRIKLNDLPYLPTGAQQSAVAIRVDGLATGSAKQLQGYVTSTNNEIVMEAADPTGSATADVTMDTVVGQLMITGSYTCA